jgi:hypothetical protein
VKADHPHRVTAPQPPHRDGRGDVPVAARIPAEWVRGDLVAGLKVWAVLVPESLAYASIAGISPVIGLYAAPPALLLYALLGSSRHLIVGPMSATRRCRRPPWPSSPP